MRASSWVSQERSGVACQREHLNAVACRQHEQRLRTVYRVAGTDLGGTRLQERVLVLLGNAYAHTVSANQRNVTALAVTSRLRCAGLLTFASCAAPLR